MIYGFIGVGNMASAILRGMAQSGRFPQGTLCGYNRTPEKTLALLPTIRQTLDQWEEYLTEGLTEEEKELISSLLLRMRDKASRWMEGK